MKWFGWLVKTIVSAAVMTAVSVAVTWSMVNIYVQQFLGPFQGEEITRPVVLTDLVSYMVNQSKGANGEASNSTTDVSPEEDVLPQAEEESQPQELPQSQPAPDNALPVMGQIQMDDESFISIDELNTKKDSITPEDRTEIFTILVSHLPANEMQTISELLEGGITPEELQEAANILQENLNEEEYNKLISILMKY